MTTLTRWMPLGELVLERHRRWILDDIGFGPFTAPAADFYETDHDFVIELEVPGFEEKELGIEVSEHTLTIEGERKTEIVEADTVHVEVTFAKGVIKVHIPKGPRGEVIGT